MDTTHSRNISRLIRDIKDLWVVGGSDFVEAVAYLQAMVGDFIALRDEIFYHADNARSDVSPAGLKRWGNYARYLKTALFTPAKETGDALALWLTEYRQSQVVDRSPSILTLQMMDIVSDGKAKKEVLEHLTRRRQPEPNEVVKATSQLQALLQNVQSIIIEETALGVGIPINPDAIDSAVISPATSTTTDKPLTIEFIQLMGNEENAHICLRLLEYFALVGADGRHRLGQRTKWHLLAFTEALQQRGPFSGGQNLASTTRTLAQQIELDYSRPRKDNGVNGLEYNDKIREYISALNSISLARLTWPMLADVGRKNADIGG